MKKYMAPEVELISFVMQDMMDLMENSREDETERIPLYYEDLTIEGIGSI